jgi:hypothetical protein
MLFKRKKEMIHFSGRRQTKMGIASVVIGILDVLGFIAICLMSGLAGGKGGFHLGLIGIFLFIFSIIGFVMSYRSFKKKDIFYTFPIVGIILNGLMTVFLLIIYLIGI